LFNDRATIVVDGYTPPMTGGANAWETNSDGSAMTDGLAAKLQAIWKEVAKECSSKDFSAVLLVLGAALLVLIAFWSLLYFSLLTA
jgi:hypothetical protein